MKIRSIAVGIFLSCDDFIAGSSPPLLFEKLDNVQNQLRNLKQRLEDCDYVVQTIRLVLNPFRQWNPTLDNAIFDLLIEQLERVDFNFCSIGCCSSPDEIDAIADILSKSGRISTSVLFPRCDGKIVPDWHICKAAAAACLSLVDKCGPLGNFRFCVSFNCNAGIPFFPAAYHGGSEFEPNIVTIGLECADLLFMGFFGTDSMDEAHENLATTFTQALSPIQDIIRDACSELGLTYAGIDASVNPGLTLPDSVGVGLECLLSQLCEAKKFGEFGTLGAVSTVTSAIKTVREKGDVLLTGYSGLMLPVMEDLILAERAAQVPPMFTLRDLLVFSTVCGVGLDTVPIPGDTTVEELAAVYFETGTLAFRLNKPLSCRLLPMPGKVAGDVTDVESPYLCNTKVFSVSI